MKKTTRLFAVLTALVLVLAACSPADEGTDTTEGTTDTTTGSGLPDLDGRTVTVGVENAYLPFNYILAGETEGQGWDYDAWNEICDLLNCVAEFVEAGWPAVIDQVAQGDLDTAADGISITDERKEIVDFSEPYMVVQQKYIKQKGDDRFNSAADVEDSDAIVGTQVGTTNFELAADRVGEDRIQAFDQFALAIQALIAGDVDVVIIDDAAGLGYIGENKEEIETIDDPLQSDPLGFIYPQGSDLVDPVNEAIAELADNGFFAEIGEKWFGPEFDVSYDDL
jgi:polar amino acid transport system substrate-binding protein